MKGRTRQSSSWWLSCWLLGLAGAMGAASALAHMRPEFRVPKKTEEGWTSVVGNDRQVMVTFRCSTETIPLSRLFDLEVHVKPATRGVRLRVEAVMPEHRHGMNVKPTITALGEGRFRVEGMLFHMPGRWQFHFDITQGALTERAQLDVTLE